MAEWLGKGLQNLHSPVQIWAAPPYHLNTLDQLAKSPVVSRCSGFFTAGNFLKTPWINGRFAEVQTGFEPLFFHIQAELWRQRPFSEGCGGWFSEKSGKNLSQSYGHWIVGFDGPMTSAFFALKKGAENGGVLYVRRKHIAEGKISARDRTEAPAQGVGRKAAGGRSDPHQMEWTAALLG